MIGLGRAFRQDLCPFSCGATYLNFLGDEGSDRVRAGFGEHYDRLARIKAQWDPDNLFHGNQDLRRE
jgi:FAD/FMN-containing dehydrogenase